MTDQATTDTSEAKPARPGWTPESLAKATATRTRKAAERKQRLRDAVQGVVRAADSLPAPSTVVPAAPVVVAPAAPADYDWLHAPLDEAQARLGDLRRVYDAAARIILARQAESRPRWTCFTQLHRDLIPASVQRLCKKSGDDGKWASRDDGVFEMRDGLRVPAPVFCCSAICHEAYLRTKQLGSLSRH